MHSLNLVHYDIKPQNIAYSYSFRKWVLIDFGLSAYSTTKPGFLKDILFKGSFHYCSP
jgi:serine/threonine protein kinase